MCATSAIVIGAGPAGLGTALALAHEGIDVSVFERQTELGGLRRGETIRYNPEMEALLGHGFFDRQAVHRIHKRRYYSHTGQRLVDRTISSENIIIDWTSFVRSMAEIVVSSGAHIHTGTEVMRILEESGRVGGVRIRTADAIEKDVAGAVFACGGFADPAARRIGIDRRRLDRPVRKYLMRGFSGPEDRLEYHFHANPERPAVGAIFPRSRGEVEVIFMGLTSAEPPEMEAFTEEHVIFKEHLRGAVPFYTLETAIPMGAMLTRCCYRPGLVLAGDALGHVQARGGSGIRTAFLIGYGAGKRGARALKTGAWEDFDRAMRANPHLRALQLHNLVYAHARSLLFRPAATPSAMDRFWPVLKTALR